jgi:hypothetical protein
MVYMNFEKLLPEFCTIENGVDENEDSGVKIPKETGNG